MISKLCYINVNKLLEFKFQSIDEEEDFEGIGISVEVIENGEYITYSFNDNPSFENFIISLQEKGVDYVLVDDDGEVIGWDWEDYED